MSQLLSLAGIGRARGPARSADEHLANLCAALLAGVLLIFIAFPLANIFSKALQDKQGVFVGFTQIAAILAETRIQAATLNSVFFAAITTALVIPSALAFAFAITRSRIPGKPIFRVIGLAPLLAPSLMPAISLVYLFGNQGLLKSLLGSQSIYGGLGIVMGEVFYTFPHALIILTAALSVSDARLYEAAEAMGANRLRRFLTITLPNARYGLIAAATLVFVLVITDFGVPKVIAGQTNVLALEAYKQVIGQQNFNKGAVIGLLLLLPAIASFVLERHLRGRQAATMTGKSVAYFPKTNLLRDLGLGTFCSMISVFLLALVGVAIAAAFMKLWPYNLHFTLSHFDFDDMDGGGWLAFRNSLRMAAFTATIGTSFIFLGAYLTQKLQVSRVTAFAIQSLAVLPMAVPGLVLGLGYVMFFNSPDNPLKWLYGSMSILVISCIAHFYTTAHLTISTSLRQIDGEIEAVARSLRRPWWYTCTRVTLPIVIPSLLNIARFLFVSSMTTVSCVIFLYTPDTVLAAVAIMNLDDAGDTAAAAAMSTLIFGSSLLITLLMNLVSAKLVTRTQAWRNARQGQ